MDIKYVKCKIGLFLLITLFAVCAQAQEAKVPRFRQYHRVFAVERDKIDAACKKYPNSFRDGIIVAEDAIQSLRRFKDDVKEVASGYECGIGLEKFNDLKEGDIFEAYITEEYRD